METLMLSAAFEPMRRISWQRAMLLLVAGRAEVVEVYADRTVRTVRVTFQMPSVMRALGGYHGSWRLTPKFSRQNLWKRDGGKCAYCQRDVPIHKSTYDHVMPRSRGGKTAWTNIVIACVACNQRKGARTPEEAGMTLLVKPRRPSKGEIPWGSMVTWSQGMPLSWRQYLTDRKYWSGKLDSD